MIRRLTLVLLAVAVALPLSACGRKGKPIPPEGSVYPRQYPKIEAPEGLPPADEALEQPLEQR